MVVKTLIVENQHGIHARPSAAIVKCLGDYDCQVRFETAEGSADARSIMEILMLKITIGMEVKITADGPDEEKAVADLERLFKDHFGVEE